MSGGEEQRAKSIELRAKSVEVRAKSRKMDVRYEMWDMRKSGKDHMTMVPEEFEEGGLG